MSLSQVGVLIPLNKSLKEDKSLPELKVLEGDNVIGRNNVPVTDKRLSRKHITLSASTDGSADLLVEGMNPVVIKSGGQRRILTSGERANVNSGNLIELIPGSYFFKYVTLSGRNSAMVGKGCDSDSECKTAGSGTKRTREESTTGASAGKSLIQHRSETKVNEESSVSRNNVNAESKRQNVSASGKSEEALRHFHISDDKSPSSFRLMKVRGLPEWANTSCVSIDEVIKGDVLVAILSNYMVDLDWLLSACPKLKQVPHVLVVHGESDGTLEYMKVRLVASVPGYHSGSNLKKWGHMKLRSILERCTFDNEFKKSPLAYQGRGISHFNLLP